MYVSKDVDYGFRTMIVIASTARQPMTAKDLAKRFHIPHNFISLILPKLTRAGLVRVEKQDKRDVLKLGREPGAIALLHIIEALNGPIQLISLSGAAKTEAEEFHPMLNVWDGLKTTVETYLERITLDRFLLSLDRLDEEFSQV